MQADLPSGRRPVARLQATFRSLSTRNVRLYLGGQAVSLCGTWMQRLAQEWLVLELTGSGTWLGIVAAAQFLPMLTLGPVAGVIADRADKHRLVICTQVVAGALALVLGLLTLTELVTAPMVAGLALALGIVTALDSPTRQTLVVEMVDVADIPNVVTLNSTLFNAARAVGPALAGLFITTVGLGWSFLVNAASYLVVVAALQAMDTRALRRAHPAARSARQFRAGLAHVRDVPILRDTLILMAIAGVFAYEFLVTLPLFARYTLEGDATTLGTLNAALGTGAVVGGLTAAGGAAPTRTSLLQSGAAFGLAMAALAISPTLTIAMACLVAVGISSIRFLTTANALLQLHAAPSMRGRVMALWTVAFLGSTPVGGPIVGLIGQHAGPRWAIGVGATALILAITGSMIRRTGTEPTAPWRDTS